MGGDVPSETAKVRTPPVKSRVSDSCSSNDLLGPLTKMRNVLPAGAVGGTLTIGLVAAQMTVTTAALLFVLPQLFDVLTQICMVPTLSSGKLLRTAAVAPAIGFDSTPAAPTNH